MTTGPRTSHVFLAAFFASFVGGGLGAGIVVSYVLSDRERVAAESAEERRRAVEEEVRRRVDEERRQFERDARRRADDEAKRRAEDERRSADQKRRAEEEARRRSEGERRKSEAPGGITCDHALPEFKGVFTQEADCYYLQHAFKFALDTQRDGGAESNWTNTRNGTTGTMKVLDTSRLADGTNCRRFEQTATVNGRKTSAAGKACFRENTWRIES